MPESADAAPDEPLFPEDDDGASEPAPATEPAPAARRWTPLLLLLILVGGTALRIGDFDQPWKNASPSQALKGFGGALYSTMARNHNRYGFENTRGAMIDCGGLRDVAELGTHRYLNHPPLYAALLALHFRAFGESEQAARLFPLIFSVLSLLMLFVVVRLVADTAAALAATALMATLPMAVYYGTFVEVQSFQVMFISLVVFWFYWKWHLTRRGGYAFGLILAFLVGAALDWPVYLLAFGLFVHHLVAPGPAGRRKVIWLGLPIAVAVAFGLTVAFVFQLSKGNDAGPLLYAFTVESVSGVAVLEHAEGWRMWTDALRGYFGTMYGWPMLVLAALWIVRALVAGLFRRAPAGGGLVFAFVCMGAGYVAAFPTGSHLHEYWSMYLIPVLCVAVALLLAEASRWTLVVGTIGLAAWLGMNAWTRYEPRIEYEQSYYVQAGEAIREVTAPEDSLMVLAIGTEKFFYGWYGDRTVNLIDPYIVAGDPSKMPPIVGRWLVAPRDLDRHPFRSNPVVRSRFEEVSRRLFGALDAKLERREAGPLIFVRLRSPEAKPAQPEGPGK